MAQELPQKRTGRLKGAWHVLMGQRLTPLQIEAEWAEYRDTFNQLLQRWSALLARMAKAEKERIERLSDHLEPERRDVAPPRSQKDALRQMARDRGLVVVPGQTALRFAPASQAVPIPPDPDEMEDDLG